MELGSVPADVVAKAKLVFLDTLGIGLASATMDFGIMMTRVTERLGGPKANAVMANGTEELFAIALLTETLIPDKRPMQTS